MTASGMSDWWPEVGLVQDGQLLDKALAGLYKIAVEAGVLEQTWHAADMTEVATMITDKIRWTRERIGELEAETARLKAEKDAMEGNHQTIHVKSSFLQEGMNVCRDEDPGTVLRETDGLHRDYVLGEDRTWTAR